MSSWLLAGVPYATSRCDSSRSALTIEGNARPTRPRRVFRNREPAQAIGLSGRPGRRLFDFDAAFSGRQNADAPKSKVKSRRPYCVLPAGYPAPYPSGGSGDVVEDRKVETISPADAFVERLALGKRHGRPLAPEYPRRRPHGLHAACSCSGIIETIKSIGLARGPMSQVITSAAPTCAVIIARMPVPISSTRMSGRIARRSG